MAVVGQRGVAVVGKVGRKERERGINIVSIRVEGSSLTLSLVSKLSASLCGLKMSHHIKMSHITSISLPKVREKWWWEGREE